MAEVETSYETTKTPLIEPSMTVSRVERRRSWHLQQKIAITQESCAPGALVT